MRAGVWKLPAAVVLALLIMTAGILGDDLAWFDWEKCETCKHLMSTPDLWKSMKVETVKMSNGIAMIYTVAPDKLDDYRTAHKEMRSVMEKALAGGEAKLCGRCQSMFELINGGATREYVDTSTGGLCLITAGDEKMQQKIWSFQEKNEEMIKKMEPPKQGAPQEKG